MESIDDTQAGPIHRPESAKAAGVTRRDFFGLTWRVLTAFVAGQGACLGLRFLASRKAEGNFGEVMTVGLIGDFPPGTITPYDQARFFLIRFEDGAFLALNSTCTHLACVVGWDEARNQFSCPCHGSEFELDGSVINAPAPRPLDRFAVLIEDDRVKVDTREILRRTVTTPDDLVYAPDQPNGAGAEESAAPRVTDGAPLPIAPADLPTPDPTNPGSNGP